MSELIQVKNPRTKNYTIVDKTQGKVISTNSRKPIPKIPIIKRTIK